MTAPRRPPRILVVGGGYVGLYAALRLQRRLHAGEATVTVVDAHSHMTYQPFLPEAAAGSVQPRHVVVPLRGVLEGCEVLTAEVTQVRHAERTVVLRTADGVSSELGYDVLVLAPGGVARTADVPGLAGTAVGFRTVADAVHLRNHVLGRLDLAASETDPDRRRRALTFLVVGGGYAGIEALGELEDLARTAREQHRGALGDTPMRWVLVDAADRLLPEVGPRMAEHTLEALTGRGIEVHLGTRVTDLTDGHVRLDDGTSFEAGTVVWTAGVAPSPLLAASDLPTDATGRLLATPYLTVEGVPDAWTAGDCAAVPDLAASADGALCAPSAQHAVRQARRLADNIVAELRGHPRTAYAHAHAGSVASLGLHKGVAEIYGLRLTGYPAWFVHRAYHVGRVPTLDRKVRVVADWALSLVLRREVVGLPPGAPGVLPPAPAQGARVDA